MKKRLLFFALAIASLFASCKKEENQIFDIITTTVTTGAGPTQEAISYTEIYCSEKEAESLAKRMTSRTEAWVNVDGGSILVTVDTKARYQMCRGSSGHPQPPKKQGGSRY